MAGSASVSGIVQNAHASSARGTGRYGCLVHMPFHPVEQVAETDPLLKHGH
jgi:hypothetical protein